MDTMVDKKMYKTKKLIILFSILLSLIFVMDLFAARVNNNFLLIPRQSAELCLQTASTLKIALNYLDEIPNIDLTNEIDTLDDFIMALRKDIESARDKRFALLSSHTLEQIGRFGLGKMPDVVNALKKAGKLPHSFKLPATFGMEDFATAIGKHIGKGRLDIDIITSYLDGLNKAAWAVVGYMIGGAEGASLYQSMADTAVKLMRQATLPLFEKMVLAWRGQKKQIIEQWQTLQKRRIYDGLSIQPISEIYSIKTLKNNGFSEREIYQLDNIAHELNQKFINMKKDFGIKKIEEFKKVGKVNIGGVYIDPKFVRVGEMNKKFKEKIIKERPSQDELMWSIEILGE